MARLMYDFDEERPKFDLKAEMRRLNGVHSFACNVHGGLCWTSECPHFGVPEFSSAEEAWHVVDTTKDEALHRAACEYLQRNHE
jgi:hypothetical protein